MSRYEREQQALVDILDREFEEKFNVPSTGLRDVLPRLSPFETWIVFHVYTGVVNIFVRSVDVKNPDPDVRVVSILGTIFSTVLVENNLEQMNMDRHGQELLKSLLYTATRGIVAKRGEGPAGMYSYEQMICMKIHSIHTFLVESPPKYRNLPGDWSPNVNDLPARGEKPYDERASMTIHERRYGRQLW